jgi:AMP-polyphosphate phosphotransferase
VGRLDKLDLSLKLSRDEEAKRIEAAQQRLLALRLLCGGLPVPGAPGEGRLGPPVLVLFEGWTRRARAARSGGWSHPWTRATCA